MHPNHAKPVAKNSPVGLDQLAAIVAARVGLHFPTSRRSDLMRGAQLLAQEHGKDPHTFLESLVTAPLTDRQIEVLTAHLTVGETYFFREKETLNAFQNHILPELIRQRVGGDQRIRIWSAGCSTGEEAYTIAMLLAESLPNLNAWNVRILGTDINSQAIEKAIHGVYPEWSFRGVSAALKDKYFIPQGHSQLAVSPNFKKMVSFDCLNLAMDGYPSLENNTNAMDVIFCRNVMMYFAPEMIQKTLRRFYNCLVEGGWLMVAPCETMLLHDSEFVSVPIAGATLYRKDTIKSTVVSDSLATPPLADKQPPKTAQPRAAMMRKGPQTHHRGKTAASRSIENYVDVLEKSLAAYQAGRYSDAEASLQALVSSEQPGGGDAFEVGKALALMARIHADQGKLELAADWAQKAIDSEKTNPDFYYLFATIAEEQNRSGRGCAGSEAGNLSRPYVRLGPFCVGAYRVSRKRPPRPQPAFAECRGDP